MSKLFMFNARGTKIIVKLQKGYKKFLNYFELCGRGTKTFYQIISGLRNFFNSSKIPSALVPGIKNDYSLTRNVYV